MKTIKRLEISKNKPWLILGKGPSFSKIWDIHLEDYYLFGLNHVINKIYCNLALFIDLEVIKNLYTWDCDNLIVPYHPHLNCRPTNRTLKEWIVVESYLEFFANGDRLYTYDLSTYKGNDKIGGTEIRTRYFSAESAFRILINAGVKQIHSLGIDGGTEYANEFSDLKPLTNGRKNFNDQFKEINSLIEMNNIEYKAL